MKAFFRFLIARQLEQRVKKLIATRQVKIVAITGSVGKTSTKLAVAAVLQQKYRVLAHEGNYNSEIGLPLSIFELEVPGSLLNPIAWLGVLSKIDAKLQSEYPYEVLVLEMGADQPNDIQKFMRYITPDVGIVTAIEPVHLEGFGSIEAIAAEKMALARGSRAVVLNAENKRVMTEAVKLDAPVQTYGVDKGGTHWSAVERGKDLVLSGVLHLTEDEVRVSTHFTGRHNLAPLAAAACVGEELGLTPAEIKTGIQCIEPFAGRMRVLKGLNESIIIDDTYNAAPIAVLAAIDTLKELPGRKIAILGSMNELGELAEASHRKVGVACKGIDMLIMIGQNANKYIAAGAAEAGLKPEQIHTTTSPFVAGELVAGLLRKGDVVLAKGSQNGVFAEEAVALLLADKKDRTKLVRQSPAWLAKKREQFL